MKVYAVFSLAVLILTLAVSVPAQPKRDLASVPFSTAPYKVGERLTFNVSFSNFISVAHVELQVVSRGTFFGREGLELRAHVETTGVVNAALFAINNDYITYVDPATGIPFRAQQVLREATRTSDTFRDFNQPAGTDVLAPKERAIGFPETYDFLSALYRLRALPLTEGSTYNLTARGESNEEYQTELKVTGRKVLKTSVGSFNALVCQVRVTNNSQVNAYRVQSYFSDDERHVPVLITARHAAGEIRIELAGSEFVSPPQPKPSPSPPIATVLQPSTLPITVPVAPRSSASNQTESPADDGDNDSLSLPFKVGEQLNYLVFLGNSASPVGSATFQVRAHSRYFNHDGLLLTVSAQTNGAAQRLFNANDQIRSYVDPKTLLPFRSEMSLIEGTRRSNQTLTINQDYGNATTSSGQRIEIPVGTHDYLSFFYTVRTFNLAPPKRNAISILINNTPKTLFIGSMKRETIQIGSQTIPAIAISLTTDDPQSDKFQLRAWVSDDERRLPLRLVAQTQLGLLRADLAIIPVTSQ